MSETVKETQPDIDPDDLITALDRIMHLDFQVVFTPEGLERLNDFIREQTVANRAAGFGDFFIQLKVQFDEDDKPTPMGTRFTMVYDGDEKAWNINTDHNIFYGQRPADSIVEIAPNLEGTPILDMPLGEIDWDYIRSVGDAIAEADRQ